MCESVRCSNEKVLIPTHLTHPDEKNPIFFEKRNVQGASGNIFPMALCDRMEASFEPVPYTQLRLENEYIDVTMLPELGGRIQTALDKRNGYDFIFRNPTIKPAQIGLCGPWISGGIEFNWPQHHRPTTFKPVDHCVETHADGSQTVWMGEIEPLNRTKGMVGVTVYPGKTYLQAKVRLFNRTPYPQSFMWWANLGVATNDRYRAVFPGDIHWASDHAWASTSKFPFINGPYKNIDLGADKDVRDFPAMPIPASFFTYNSRYDFLSGYDFGANAGIVHVADRHVSPGKKMFTWGISEFSEAWYRNLSDGDGRYIELMTGIYTQNQPDFSWIMPYEYKTAEQYWYPIHDIGEVKNATLHGAIGFERADGQISFALNVTGAQPGSRIVLTWNDTVLYDRTADLTPETAFKDVVGFSGDCADHELEIRVLSHVGKELVSFRPEKPEAVTVPPALTPAPQPDEMDNPDTLFLHALHIWQYRHPYLDPMDYLKRALELDENHIMCNNLAGKIRMERGEFDEAAALFAKAAATSTIRNPNPYDTEPFYNLGVLQKLRGRYDEAYGNLFKAVWVYAHKSSGYLAIAEIDCIRGDLDLALEHVETALESNATNFTAWRLKASILRRLGRLKEALDCLAHIRHYDKLDYVALYETCLVWKEIEASDATAQAMGLAAQEAFSSVIRQHPESYLDMAIEYGNAGFYQEAADVLEGYLGAENPSFPILHYYLGYYLRALGKMEKAQTVWEQASSLCVDGCLHSRLESFSVLEMAMALNPSDSHAPYFLGNMYYGRKSFEKGIDAFSESVARKADFPTAYRNLAIGLFDKRGQIEEAGQLIEKAFHMDETDARVFFELMQYRRSTNTDAGLRLEQMRTHRHLVEEREDLYAKLAATHMEVGDYVTAKEMLEGKTFHPFEGGEALINRVYVNACLLEGMQRLENGDLTGAGAFFLDASRTPPNFNMGKINAAHPHAHVDYHLGLVSERMGDAEEAEWHYRACLTDTTGMPDMMYHMGLACGKLGETSRAQEWFRQVLSAAEALEHNRGRYPYFTASLVNTLPFEHDMAKNDLAISHFYKGLAYRGLGDIELSTMEFEAALAIKGTLYMARVMNERNRAGSCP